jgi:hypothetical protein
MPEKTGMGLTLVWAVSEHALWGNLDTVWKFGSGPDADQRMVVLSHLKRTRT